MKRILLPLLLLALLLAGCNSDSGHTTGQTTAATEPVPLAYLRDHGNSIEELTQGAVEAYSLEGRSVTGFRFFGDRLLAFTTADHVELTTVLTLGGQELGILKSTILDCALSPEHLMLSSDGQTFCYYHNMENSLVLLDAELNELRRIQLPDQVTDRPVISQDLSTAYYSSGRQIYALNLESGLPRLLKEHSCLSQQLTALHFHDTVLEVLLMLEDGQTQVAFISPENGETTGIDKELLTLTSEGDRYLLQRLDGSITETLVGTAGGQVMAMDTLPGQTVSPAYPMDSLAISQGNTVSLCDLQTGRITSRVELGDDVLILEADADPAGDSLWLRALDQQNNKLLLLRWRPAQTKVSESTKYIHKRYTAREPDTEALAQLQQRADALGKELGVTFVVNGQLPAPEGYEYVYEHQVLALSSALEKLQAGLSALPPEFLQGLCTVNQSDTIHIGLVRSILDIAGKPSSDTGGMHLVSAGDHYIVLTVDADLKTALNHHLCHVLDSYVYAHSDDYDKWEKLNPKGFAYAGTYDVQPDPDEPLLQGETLCFVSAYGMSFAKEDRATLFAAALESGNEALMALPRMQSKLQHLCTAIRDAFRWKETEITLPWEQYLKEE